MGQSSFGVFQVDISGKVMRYIPCLNVNSSGVVHYILIGLRFNNPRVCKLHMRALHISKQPFLTCRWVEGKDSKEVGNSLHGNNFTL